MTVNVFMFPYRISHIVKILVVFSQVNSRTSQINPIPPVKTHLSCLGTVNSRLKAMMCQKRNLNLTHFPFTIRIFSLFYLVYFSQADYRQGNIKEMLSINCTKMFCSYHIQKREDSSRIYTETQHLSSYRLRQSALSASVLLARSYFRHSLSFQKSLYKVL